MTPSMPVRVLSPLFHAAVAELPVSSHLSDEVRGSVVGLDGAPGWIPRVLEAAARGAVAAVVAHPASTPVEDLRDLRERVGIPVVVDRPRVRPDLVAAAEAAIAAGRPAHLISVDGIAPTPRAATALRAVAGWMRVAGGGAPRLLAQDAGIALLESPAGIPITAGVILAAAGPVRVRVRVIGPERTTILATSLGVEVSRETEHGKTILPALHESTTRVALRRAIHTVRTGATPSDLDDLVADAELAQELSRIIDVTDPGDRRYGVA